MKKHETKTRSIDGAKLRKLINSHGLTLSDASHMIGRSTSYVSQCCNTGKMPISTMMLIEKMWSIRYDDYKPDVKVTFETKLEEEKSEISISQEDVSRMVRVALMDAINSKLFEKAIQDSINPSLNTIKDKLNVLLTDLGLDPVTYRRINKEETEEN